MITVEKIAQALHAADIEGLLADGAPDDEYDSEAADIAAAVEQLSPSELTVENLAAVIKSIWDKSFGHDENESEEVREIFINLSRNLLS